MVSRATTTCLYLNNAKATFDEAANSPVVSTGQLMVNDMKTLCLFSLDSLDNDSQPATGMMTPSATGNTEASGLIDLAMLAGRLAEYRQCA